MYPLPPSFERCIRNPFLSNPIIFRRKDAIPYKGHTYLNPKKMDPEISGIQLFCYTKSARERDSISNMGSSGAGGGTLLVSS